MLLEKVISFLPIVALLLALLFGAMYTAFRSLTIKMEDILKDVSKGIKIREEIFKSMLAIVEEVSKDEYNNIQNKLVLFQKFNTLEMPIDKVKFDKQLEEIVLIFLNLPKKYNELNNNFKFVELTLRYKDLETRIINEKYRYNGIVDKYNLRRESSIGKFFGRLYRFNKKEKLYLSDEIVEILSNSNITEDVL